MLGTLAVAQAGEDPDGSRRVTVTIDGAGPIPDRSIWYFPGLSVGHSTRLDANSQFVASAGSDDPAREVRVVRITGPGVFFPGMEFLRDVHDRSRELIQAVPAWSFVSDDRFPGQVRVEGDGNWRLSIEPPGTLWRCRATDPSGRLSDACAVDVDTGARASLSPLGEFILSTRMVRGAAVRALVVSREHRPALISAPAGRRAESTDALSVQMVRAQSSLRVSVRVPSTDGSSRAPAGFDGWVVAFDPETGVRISASRITATAGTISIPAGRGEPVSLLACGRDSTGRAFRGTWAGKCEPDDELAFDLTESAALTPVDDAPQISTEEACRRDPGIVRVDVRRVGAEGEKRLARPATLAHVRPGEYDVTVRSADGTAKSVRVRVLDGMQTSVPW